ncbi:Arc family DNA-binding protein [Aquamicrobium zhengzhouense]|uniref:Arc family DNA-binding protein n=1 Tax=Aquamicrobium zhengzhouense TaxID=2781738 RepID=A0ABS0SAL4_9HYPH|nr:Arc family DNA-binding protein [Aquamicrobium zhengzhouense]MBI1620328.1 Arc family DNA-binding protein [Aquamicrobium zhengzhouense]
MSQPDPSSFHLRMPPALQKQIKRAALDNDRSINAEIVARLERTFGDDDQARAEAARLLSQALTILDRGTS